MKNFRLICLLMLLLQACGNIEMFEKTTTVPAHSWSGQFRPTFDFEIDDSSQQYKCYFVIRHTEQYRYNNLYLNLKIKSPGEDSVKTFRRELVLAAEGKWLGVGMNDIYEHRVLLPVFGNMVPLKKGSYSFTLEQIMREDPLEHVLDVGIRVEKN